MSTHEWERAGMVDQCGFVGKVVPAGKILVPGSIALEGDSIHWERTGRERFVTPDRSLLNGFVQLWSKPPLSVVSFAKRWGVLATGERNRPCAEGFTSGRDSIEAWRFFSHRAMAVLNLIASLKQGKIGAIDDWKELGAINNSRKDAPEEFARMEGLLRKFPLPQFRVGFPGTLQQAGGAIADEVNAWMTVWRERRVSAASDFRVDNSGPGLWDMQVDFHGFLFPALAFQLCLIAVNADSLYCCSGCGSPYVRPRKRKRPRPGQANYCGECVRLGIPVRRASEKYRERKANAKTKTRKR